MAQATEYNRKANFRNIQTLEPSKPLPGNRLDDEFNALKLTTDELRLRAARIQRDDGELGNETVGFDQVQPELLTGFNRPSPWAPGRLYRLNAAVLFDNVMYRAVIEHTSASSFGVDAAAGRWEVTVDFGVPAQQAVAARDVAVGARDAARLAEIDAEAARDSANGHRLNAQNAQNGAMAARDEANSARDVVVPARNEVLSARNEVLPARDRAVLAQEIAEGFASDIVSQGNVPIYDSRSAAAPEAPQGVVALRLNRFDPGSWVAPTIWRRVEAEPSHFAKFQAGNSWFEMADEFVTPAMVNARGNGSYDDTDRIEELIALGRPIFWGGPDKQYHLTRQITVQPMQPLQWVGHGAVLRFRPTTDQYRGIFIDGLPSGSTRIDGLLIDGGDMVQQGLRIQAANGATGDVTVRNTFVKDARRNSRQFSEGGSGIHLNVCHEVVNLENVGVKKLRLSAGAGIAGTAGVQGIMVRPGGGSRPKLISARTVYCEDIKCDDLGYNADQDGMLFFVDRASSQSIQHETYVNVAGAFFKNCLGRAIKGQAESMDVVGCRVVRTEGHTVVGAGVDIDLQVGGGKVAGFSALYDGANSAPARAVILSTTDETNKPTASGNVDGVEIAMTNGASMESIVQTSQRVGIKASYRARNVSVVGGTLESVVRLAGGNMGSQVFLGLEGVSAAPTLAMVKATNGPATGAVFLDDVVNTGDTPVPALARNSTVMNVVVSVDHSWGLSDSKYNAILPTGQTGIAAVGDIQRVNRVGAADDRVGGGTERKTVFQLAAGEVRELPESFRAVTNAGTVEILVARSRQSAGLFRYDVNGAEICWAGSEMSAGLTAEPSTGLFRIWAGPNGRPMIANRDTSTRIFTCELKG